MGKSRSSSSSSSSSDDDHKERRLTTNKQPKQLVYVNNRCHCTIISKESSAVLKNIVLEATLDLAVTEKISLDVPMQTECFVRTMGHQPVVVDTPVKPVVVPKPQIIKVQEQKVEESKPVPVPAPAPVQVKVEPKVQRVPSVVKEVFKIIVEVNDLPKMDTFLNGGAADPYFYFYLDSKLYFGGRDKAIKNSRKGQWSFPILASLVRGASKITIKWFDFDQVGKDDEIGTTEVEVSKAIRHITAGTSNKSITNFLTISGKKAEKANVSLTIIKE